jgi:hypothetical protein
VKGRSSAYAGFKTISSMLENFQWPQKQQDQFPVNQSIFAFSTEARLLALV